MPRIPVTSSGARSACPQDLPLVLSSFGGYGVSGFDVSRLDCLRAYGVVLTHRGDEDALPGAAGRRLSALGDPRSMASGLRYEDLVAAVDVVATKPGYGIVSECIANETAMLYTSRGQFVEYEVLVAEMPRYLRCSFIEHEDLFAGRWKEPLDRILAQPAPLEKPATNGAEVMAEMIGSMIDR